MALWIDRPSDCTGTKILDVGGVVVGDDVELLAEMELVRTDLPAPR